MPAVVIGSGVYLPVLEPPDDTCVSNVILWSGVYPSGVSVLFVTREIEEDALPLLVSLTAADCRCRPLVPVDAIRQSSGEWCKVVGSERM